MDTLARRLENAEMIDGVVPSRLVGATLISGRSTPMTRSELATLPAVQTTQTFKPVPHIELIRGLEFALAEQDIHIHAEKFSVNREGNALFGVMDLVGLQITAGNSADSGFRSALGLRTANDKSMSLQIAVGAKVLVCDNLAFSADMIALKRKHTSKLDLIGELKDAVKRFVEKFWHMSAQFDALKNKAITGNDARIRIYDIFAKGVLAPRYFPSVHAAYFSPTGEEYETCYKSTLWALHNAFTWTLKSASLPVQQRVTLDLAHEFSI